MVTQIAVLDDYHGVAPLHYAKLDPSSYVVKHFPETLRPYQLPDTPQAERDELVQRLEPFDVIGNKCSSANAFDISILTMPRQQP